ncbi:hypothetical protein, partial [Lacticaseibacillus manihotivorans]|uniref:hypothetical protein n=1 Tax=Lacticaseibacillus manihotivorans TaxID=88233 RepID=UPI001F45D9BC
SHPLKLVEINLRISQNRAQFLNGSQLQNVNHGFSRQIKKDPSLQFKCNTLTTKTIKAMKTYSC